MYLARRRLLGVLQQSEAAEMWISTFKAEAIVTDQKRSGKAQTAGPMIRPQITWRKWLDGRMHVTLPSVQFSQKTYATNGINQGVSHTSALLLQLSIISVEQFLHSGCFVTPLSCCICNQLLFNFPVTLHHPAISRQMFVPIILENNLRNSNWILVSWDSSVPHIRYLFCYIVILL